MIIQFTFGYSQISSLHYINYTTKDGLPSNEVYDVLQDRKGYMWFSTDFGLSRFDGYEFKNYGINEGLNDPVIFDLYEDHYGRIWMNSLNHRMFYLAPGRDSIVEWKSVKLEMLMNVYPLKMRYVYDDKFDVLSVVTGLRNEFLQFKNNQYIGCISKSFKKCSIRPFNSAYR